MNKSNKKNSTLNPIEPLVEAVSGLIIAFIEAVSKLIASGIKLLIDKMNKNRSSKHDETIEASKHFKNFK